MSHTIYTFGYHGQHADALLRRMRELNGVLCDIRYSRKSSQPGWSESDLRRLFGRRYLPVRLLGNKSFKGGAISILNLAEGLKIVEITAEYSPVVLLCQCAELARCHRRTVALALRERGHRMEELSLQEKFPRLSETLKGPRRVDCCNACGARGELERWREHGDLDQAEEVAVVLCHKCAEKIIEPHPRLYSQMQAHEPGCGSMPICRGCRHRHGTDCLHPARKCNGGTGLILDLPKPASAFVDYAGPRGRTGECLKMYRGPVQCAGYHEGARCKGCDAPIRWRRTEAGKPTPRNLDGTPHWATCSKREMFKRQTGAPRQSTPSPDRAEEASLL